MVLRQKVLMSGEISQKVLMPGVPPPPPLWTEGRTEIVKTYTRRMRYAYKLTYPETNREFCVSTQTLNPVTQP